MSNIEWLEKPHLVDPVAIIGFEGWNDASDAASGVVEYLVDQAGVSPFARMARVVRREKQLEDRVEKWVTRINRSRNNFTERCYGG